MPTPSIDQLNQRFALAGPATARFEPGRGHLPRLAISTAAADAHVYLHGAHVTHWHPRDMAPVLWMSQESYFEDGRPIRGGVPICFPWFGPKADDPAAPSHGLVRTRAWDVTGVYQTADGEVVATLETQIPDFEVTYTVTVGPTLTLSLHIRNATRQPRTFEAALHSYFTVGDINQVRITGLAGTTYIDKMDPRGPTRKVQGDEPIMFAAETDRVYLNTAATCVLDDPVLLRRITIEKSGSQATVVWNPWTTKSAKLDDFGNDEWPGMCCIETACAADNAVTLAPAADHAITAAISVQRTA